MQVFAPLGAGAVLAAAAHLRSLDRLRVFLFVPPPPSSLISRAAFAQARREKFPFALLWARASGQLACAALALLGAAGLLYSRQCSLAAPVGSSKASALSLGYSLLPLTVFAVMNVVHGLFCKGGSWLRLVCAKILLVQLLVISCKVDSSAPAPLGIDDISWTRALLPGFILRGVLFWWVVPFRLERSEHKKNAYEIQLSCKKKI